MGQVAHSRQELIELLEHLTEDLKRGNPTFCAIAVITPSAADRSRPIVAVGSFQEKPPARLVTAAFAEMAQDAEDLGFLTPN